MSALAGNCLGQIRNRHDAVIARVCQLGIHPQLVQAWNWVAIGRFGVGSNQLEDALLDPIAHDVLPAAGLLVDEFPLEPDHIGQQSLGKAVLAHDGNGLVATGRRQLEVTVAADDQKSEALHSRTGLRHGWTRLLEAFGDSGSKRNLPLLLEFEDCAQVHLNCVNEVCRHSASIVPNKLVNMPEITIPNELLPEDGRFGCGPSRVRAAQVAALATEGAKLLGTSHRQAPVKNLVKRVQDGLFDLFHKPEGYEIVLGNGGSTAFWDAAAFSMVERKAQNLVHGEFGAKFATALTNPWLDAPTVINGTPGSRLELKAEAGVDSYAYAQNETSTGVVTPVKRVAGADAGALFFTDATSAAGGIDFDPLQTDVYYFAPQKNFASDGGLWFALMSPAAIERVERIASSGRYIPEFLSVKTAIDNSRLNQTLNTPAIATLFLLAEQVDWINSNGGLGWADARTRAASDHLYEWADASEFANPFVAEPAHRSQVVVTIDFDDSVPAADVAKVLRANGIVDVEPYRKLGRNQLRVATFTATDLAEVQQLTKAIDFVVEAL